MLLLNNVRNSSAKYQTTNVGFGPIHNWAKSSEKVPSNLRKIAQIQIILRIHKLSFGPFLWPLYIL